MAVDGRAPGVSFPRIYDKAASAFLPIGEMLLEDAPAQELVPAGTGMRAALAAIDVARCDIAAIATGLHAESLDVALRYARDRQAFGQRVLDFQGIRWHAGRRRHRAGGVTPAGCGGSGTAGHA